MTTGEPLEYVNRHYGLDLHVGQRVMTLNGPGTVIKPHSGLHWVWVRLDHEPGHVPNFHPTDVRPIDEVPDDQA